MDAETQSGVARSSAIKGMFRGRDILVAEPPAEKLLFSVIVPARNEEELLPSCLRSLAEQKMLDGRPLCHDIYEVILLINNTTDRSRQVAENFRRLYPTFRLHVAERNFTPSKAHVGRCRRLLMDEACRRLDVVGNRNCAILSTDADSQATPNWIARNQEELARGVDAVGGRIVIPACEKDLLDPTTRELYRHDHLYRRFVSWVEDRFDPEPHDPWPRHHQHFGATLAVTPQIYKAVGRLPPRRRLEDVAFYDMLIRHDVRLRHSNKVKVFTSARLAGRTRAGLSTQLAEWTKCGKNGLRMPVESVAFLEYLFATRHELRLLWLDYRFDQKLPQNAAWDTSKKIRIKPAQLSAEIRSARFFGILLEKLKFYENCRKSWQDWIRLVPLNYAVAEFLELFSSYRRESATRTHPREIVENVS